MCLQCVTDSVSYGEVLPGWALMRARKDGWDEWKAGEWGLVQCNDPDVTWGGELMKDPLFGIPDEGLDLLTPEQEEAADDFSIRISTFEKNLFMHPEDGFSLVGAALAAGWKKEEGRLSHWLMHRMAEWVETHKALTNDEQLVEEKAEASRDGALQ